MSKLPHPFIKCPGGKRRLSTRIAHLVKQSGSIRRYHEICLGGGAVFFELYRQGLLGSRPAFLSDYCEPIADLWNLIKDPEGGAEYLMDSVDELNAIYPDTMPEPEKYKNIRHSFNQYQGGQETSAYFLWLNKNCHSGLIRFNRDGEFNVPCGNYKNPTVYSRKNILEVAKALKHAQIRHESFLQSLERVKPGDLCYIDPPYWDTFDGYTPEGFGKLSQIALAECLQSLGNMGVKIIASNAAHTLVQIEYDWMLNMDLVHMNTKSCNINEKDRKQVPELLMWNFNAELEK